MKVCFDSTKIFHKKSEKKFPEISKKSENPKIIFLIKIFVKFRKKNSGSKKNSNKKKKIPIPIPTKLFFPPKPFRKKFRKKFKIFPHKISSQKNFFFLVGVSCDSCLVSNFRGRRYKCLICYDYDLCATCYEGGATSTRHSADHPMQCILTRADFDLYYGGEGGVSVDLPHSFTCPFCKRMGLSDQTLLEHVTAEHTDAALEVVCPVCATLPGGEPNMVTDDFAGHLTLEHRTTNARDLISFLDEPSAIRHGGVRRIPHGGRALGGPRSRRANMHFSGSNAGLSALSPSGRESVDLIAELQQQLTSAPRRGTGPQYSQLQLLQAQVQMERNQQERRMERVTNIPRRQAAPQNAAAAPLMGFGAAATANNSISTILSVMNFGAQRDQNFLANGAGPAVPYLGAVPEMAPRHPAKLLLGRMNRPLAEEERRQLEHDRVER